MIKLPNLDDQNYIDIVEAAKRRIPVIFPEWTDFNEHDPGITIVEMFAWLKEMQQYYLNRMSDKSRENMLRLLGVERLEAAPSEVLVSFSGEVPEYISPGAEVFTEDGTAFVSTSEYKAPPFSIDRIYIDNDSNYADVTGICGEPGVAFYPFGSQLGMGERSLYIGLSEPADESFFDGAELLFDISDMLPVQRNPYEGVTPPPRGLVWEYSTPDGFKPCEVLSDKTFALSFSGGITLRVGKDLAAFRVNGGLPECRWIRARLTDCGCEDMPKISRIFSGGLSLSQKTRLAAAADYQLDKGAVIQAEDMLAKKGMVFALVRDNYGWFHAETAEITKTPFGAEVDLSDAASLAAADGKPNVRVIFCDESFGMRKMFFSSDGLSCQRFEFDPEDEVLCEDLRVMVKDRESDDEPRWQEYSYISSLSLAGPYDRCFTYDAERRMLVFGDNEHGEVPPPGSENIMVISCSVTKGASGKVMSGNLRELVLGGKSYELLQCSDSAGGRSRESIAHALGRFKASMNECSRAVTVEDYRTAALHTPGLRIADARAIPFFDRDLSEISESKAPNTVAIAVLPYSGARFPMPDPRFLAAVREHIENYRLITTNVQIIAPTYVRVDISAEIVCGTREVELARKKVQAALNGLFSIYSADGKTRFGEPVTETAVTSCICAVEGILTVKQLQINIDDNRCSRDRYGRIIIPPHAIAYCGNVRIGMAEA